MKKKRRKINHREKKGQNTPNASDGSCRKENKRARVGRKKEKFNCSGNKEQGHLFVPSCVAKSLTETILNDIGESLQSEELNGARGKGGKRGE